MMKSESKNGDTLLVEHLIKEIEVAVQSKNIHFVMQMLKNLTQHQMSELISKLPVELFKVIQSEIGENTIQSEHTTNDINSLKTPVLPAETNLELLQTSLDNLNMQLTGIRKLREMRQDVISSTQSQDEHKSNNTNEKDNIGKTKNTIPNSDSKNMEEFIQNIKSFCTNDNFFQQLNEEEQAQVLGTIDELNE